MVSSTFVAMISCFASHIAERLKRNGNRFSFATDRVGKVSRRRTIPSILLIISSIDLVFAGGMTSKEQSHLEQCQKWRICLSFRYSDLSGAISSLSHRTQFVPKLERRLDAIIRMATPLAVGFDVARGGNRSMAPSSAAIHLNLTRERRTFLCRS